MWIFTQHGFISAVRTSKDAQTLKVRSRDRQSLERLAALSESEIIATPNADYPYRVIVDELTLGAFLMNELADADYTNFKSRVSITRGHDFAHACGQVWSVMHDVEDENARKIRFGTQTLND